MISAPREMMSVTRRGHEIQRLVSGYMEQMILAPRGSQPARWIITALWFDKDK